MKIVILVKNWIYIKTPKKSVIPRSEKKYVRALKESEIIISTGPAGTGKLFWLLLWH